MLKRFTSQELAGEFNVAFADGSDFWSAIPAPFAPSRQSAVQTAAAISTPSDVSQSQKMSLAMKHGCDRALAILALVAVSPLFLVIMIAIMLEDGGPVFFRQTRTGAHGKQFRIWKFRSMVVDAEARLAAIRAQSDRDATCFKMKHDPRVTRVGAILRRLSLDELPQLLNILCGEMSLVGPRPALPGEVLSYTAAARERLAGRPGLTCTWQVSGRADIPFEQQVALDVEYLRTRSMMTDVVLMLRTIPAVLTARGAY